MNINLSSVSIIFVIYLYTRFCVWQLLNTRRNKNTLDIVKIDCVRLGTLLTKRYPILSSCFVVFFRLFLLSLFMYEMHRLASLYFTVTPYQLLHVVFFHSFYATNKHLTHFFEFHTEIWMCQVLFTYSFISVSLSISLSLG